jgi:shikimate kinase
MQKNPSNSSKHIVLVGTGGAGKTSIGAVLAEFLGLEFMDSDEVIINREQCSIPDIFANKGEAYFRGLERQAFFELMAEETPHIIGSGGGAFMNDETRALIKEKALSIFIKADIEVLLKRIGEGQGRPMYEGQDTRAVLEGLIDTRYPIYEEADVIVETYDEPLEKTLVRLTEALYTHLNPA